jgi:DNA-binding NarL/FixJ family response regulator
MKPSVKPAPGPDSHVALEVVLVEDLRDLREGLAILIDGSPGLRCSHTYRTMEEALDEIDRIRADVILTDLGLPGMSGVEGIRLLRERLPALPILALTIHDTNDQVFAALCAGASGYLLKTIPPEKLLESIREGAEGGAPMSPEIARRVVALFREFQPSVHADYHLTPQETEVLRLLVDGHLKKTAAKTMGISIHTVSFHLKNIYEKLQVHSKSEAVAKALNERLL